MKPMSSLRAPCLAGQSDKCLEFNSERTVVARRTFADETVGKPRDVISSTSEVVMIWKVIIQATLSEANVISRCSGIATVH